MEKRYSLLIICVAVMLASVFAAFIPVGTAESQGDNFNYIENKTGLQRVLIGQNLEFDNFSTPVVYRVERGDIVKTYPADSDNHIYNVNWQTSGAFYVNYRNSSDYDAQLSVEDAVIPLELRVGTTKVSFIAVGTTPLTIDTAGINLFDEDVVDLVITGPEGQISYDSVGKQQFTGINVTKLKEYGTVGLETDGLLIGNYTFQVKTVSGEACGLEAESAEKNLYRGIVYHEPSSPTPVPSPEVEVEVSPLGHTPTATPSVTTVPTPTPTPTTPTPTTSTPTPTASPTVSVTPTPTPSTPGFGFLFAITGVVLAAIYLGRRRR